MTSPLSRRETEERLAQLAVFATWPGEPTGETQREIEALETARQLAEWLETMMLQIERPDCVGWDDERDSSCPLFAQCSQRSESDDAPCTRHDNVARAWLEGR